MGDFAKFSHIFVCITNDKTVLSNTATTELKLCIRNAAPSKVRTIRIILGII